MILFTFVNDWYANLLFAFVRAMPDLRFTNENVCVCVLSDARHAERCVLFANANASLAFYHLWA